MNMNQITDARNRDFANRCLDIFKAEYSGGRILPLREIVERAIAQPPKSFYVSYDRASLLMHRAERLGIDRVFGKGAGRGLWKELYETVKALQERHPGLSMAMALCHAINFCRPSRFHITPDTGVRILSGRRYTRMADSNEHSYFKSHLL